MEVYHTMPHILEGLIEWRLESELSQAVASGVRGGRRPGRRACLAEDTCDMVCDGPYTDNQFRGDLRVDFTRCDEADHFHLARGQPAGKGLGRQRLDLDPSQAYIHPLGQWTHPKFLGDGQGLV